MIAFFGAFSSYSFQSFFPLKKADKKGFPLLSGLKKI
jgi:hypothetical protein